MAAYLLHNVEEYGIDMYGRLHGFPQDIVHVMKLPPYPDCPIPPLYFVAVNVTAFWVMAPIAALPSRRHPLVGFSIYSIIMINIVFHVMPLLTGGGGLRRGDVDRAHRLHARDPDRADVAVRQGNDRQHADGIDSIREPLRAHADPQARRKVAQRRSHLASCRRRRSECGCQMKRGLLTIISAWLWSPSRLSSVMSSLPIGGWAPIPA